MEERYCFDSSDHGLALLGMSHAEKGQRGEKNCSSFRAAFAGLSRGFRGFSAGFLQKSD